jgi:CheY-like chemotaxis protein
MVNTKPIMMRTPQHRRVLILEDELSIRIAFYVLLAGLRCEGDVIPKGPQALARTRREEFDAILLDLRCSNVNAEKAVPPIREIRPNMVGRVLVITGEVADAATLDKIERKCLQDVPRHRPQRYLLEHLRILLRFPPLPKRSHNPWRLSVHLVAGDPPLQGR